jgi:antitoxin ParD1/3/4
MTVKTSISLPDAQEQFARELVRRGEFPSLSAVVQNGIELLRKKSEAEHLETEALKALLTERAAGPFVGADEFKASVSEMLRSKRRKFELGN